MVTYIQAKAFAGTRGGGGDDTCILKKCFLISIYFNVKLIVLPNFIFLKYLISKMDFTAKKYSGQGCFTAKKGTIDKLLFLLKNIGIYP